MKKIVLFGDSMLGRFTKPRIDQLEAEAGGEIVVFNCAAGGWTSDDGARRAADIARIEPDVVVLSFGANDCAPDRLVGLDAYEKNLRVITEAFDPATVIAFLPPSIEEIDGVGKSGRTNAVLDTYRDVLRGLAAHAVDPDTAVAPLPARGEPVHEDGLHLTGAAYTLVISALARCIAETVTTPTPR